MIYNEILERGNNPIIEIPRSADKNIYVMMYSGVQAGTTSETRAIKIFSKVVEGL